MSIGTWLRRRSSNVPGVDVSDITLSSLLTDAEKRAVAVRTALRGFSGLRDIDSAPWSLSKTVGVPIKLHALRAVFIAWCQTLYGGVRLASLADAFAALRPLLAELDDALPDFYDRNIMGSDYACGAWQQNVEAARRAAGLVEAIGRLEFRPLPFDEKRSCADFLDTASFYGPDGRTNQAAWLGAQRSAIRSDCDALRSGRTAPRKLMLEPLWPTPQTAALETNLVRVDGTYGHHLQIWLRERKDGALVMGKSAAASEARMVRIANLPPEFWDSRPPADTLDAFDYALDADLDNPQWGSATWKRVRLL